MTNKTMLTPDNAPRDPAELAAAGGYVLRELAGTLGLLPDDAAMLHWQELTKHQRITAVLEGLAAYDTRAGRTGPVAPVAPPLPPHGSPMNGVVARVEPEAYAAAQAAVSAGPSRSPRRERTNGAPHAPMAGAPAREHSEREIPQLLEAVFDQMQKTTRMLNFLGESLERGAQPTLARLEAVEGQVKATRKELGILHEGMATTHDLVKLVLVLLLTQAEERNDGASRTQILAAAAADAEMLDALYNKAVPPGKAA